MEREGIVMKSVFTAGLGLLVCMAIPVEIAAAQAVDPACSSENSLGFTQTLHCGGVTIVAESGAHYTLHRGRQGRVDAVELDSKAVLIEVPAKPSGNKFEVITPQAIAAVRGTKWAVDVNGDKSSVFVVRGHVGVVRRTGGRGVALQRGEGVDVEPGGALAVKRWSPARVSALLARLGQ